MRATAADRVQTVTNTYLICAAAWLVPGGGHLWLGRTQKGLVFLVTLPLMFVTGLWLEGRLFPFQFSEPLVGLAALADVGIGLAYFVAKAMGLGAGRVVALTYEYGNSFMIVAGLLNMLVVIDAFDIAQGRK
jgi:hypothetical protein